MSNDRNNKMKLGDPSTRFLLKRLFKDYVTGQLGKIGLSLLAMALVSACTVMLAKQMEPIINDIFLNKQADLLVPISLGVVAIFVVKGVATYAQTMLMQRVGLEIIATIQEQLFRKLMRADLAYFHEESPGNLVSRFLNDANMLKGVVSNTLTSIGKDTLTAAGLIGMMFYQDWILASVAFAAFPTAILPIAKTGRRIRKVSNNTQESLGLLTTRLDEAFQGIRHVKAYNMEEHETRRVSAVIHKVLNLNIKSARTSSLLSPIMETLGGIAIAVVILYGGNEVIQGTKDPGSFFAFITALLLAYEPIKKLSKLNASMQAGLASAHRVYAVLDSQPDIQDAPNAKPLTIKKGEVLFNNVTFKYSDEAPALQHINLHAPANKTIALVGASGAGKTSILNLIPRFYDVSEGSITLDGQDVRGATLESLRQSIALVSQEIQLFDDSIRANIAYGNTAASEEEIITAARNAHAHDFISSLPEGYDTLVGPRGSRLSGGQRQRVAIARAMIKNAPILLLDEATSALDTESERHVQDALKILMEGRTTLVIAHRLSTVIDADIIYVMDRGKIIEQGSHSELLEKDGAYARLYSLQFAEEAQIDTGSPSQLTEANLIAKDKIGLSG
ncbi:ABC transporter ATP-binding protein [Kiloniella laminariae]|uniref:ABC transporter ATP-binding protein n=1 Tax=Kiloniella laminariae TaxID=454162 RepID=UPI00035C8E87|nr:ABC transporter transmembrane domain-containing protein [Kiloniella laminariae]